MKRIEGRKKGFLAVLVLAALKASISDGGERGGKT